MKVSSVMAQITQLESHTGSSFREKDDKSIKDNTAESLVIEDGQCCRNSLQPFQLICSGR